MPKAESQSIRFTQEFQKDRKNPLLGLRILHSLSPTQPLSKSSFNWQPSALSELYSENQGKFSNIHAMLYAWLKTTQGERKILSARDLGDAVRAGELTLNQMRN